ncbi:protein of unknown function [Legionella fallonii LLAP-10]|uniref:Uncharacterized protein n=1 Tax=Legionella fallonii LLAP-10 TaxID=1212491 RepID=A0A098G8P1_9GAMM|nr:protein of unknown function [Legionella fallonii LLAP-10]
MASNSLADTFIKLLSKRAAKDELRGDEEPEVYTQKSSTSASAVAFGKRSIDEFCSNQESKNLVLVDVMTST